MPSHRPLNQHPLVRRYLDAYDPYRPPAPDEGPDGGGCLPFDLGDFELASDALSEAALDLKQTDLAARIDAAYGEVAAGYRGPLTSLRVLGGPDAMWTVNAVNALLLKAAAKPETVWSEPQTLARWAKLFGRHRNTIRSWFRNNTVRARQLEGGRLWRVAQEDLPPKYRP